MEHSNLMCGYNVDFADKYNITGRRGLFDPFPKNRFENKSYLEPELGVSDERYYIEITFVFSLIVIAANIQHVINYYKFNLSYEAFVLLLSVVGGILSKLYPSFDSFTLIANINPCLTMTMFLPSIIIYTVFSIDFYIITKCFGQVIILGIFGFILRCILTGSIMVLFLDQTLALTWVNIFKFGVTCSITQPKEMLRVLKRVGEFKHITALLEAESLLSLSLWFFFMFNIRLKHQFEYKNTFAISLVSYFVGSIFFGVAIGWMTFYVLKWINTGGRAFTYTLVCISYLIYVYSSEACFSRGISLMAFLWVLHKMKSTLSPTDELFFQHIIEALGFISNTIIFAFTVIVITEQILKDIDLLEILEIVGAFVTYFVTYIVRFGVLFSLLPILRKVGYYIPWKHMLIIVICGTKGSFILCFGITTIVDENVKSNTKFLICLSVLVFHSIIVNPLFLPWLIKKLHLDHVDDAKTKNMTAILKDITNKMRSEISALKANKEYLETNWNVVENFTIIKHPYPWAESADVMENWQQRNISSTCPLCVKEEYRKGTSIGISMEANRRILQIKKINFRRQYNEGLLQSPELQLLEAAIDYASDTKTKVLNFESVKDLWTQRWFVDKCRHRLIRIVFFSTQRYIQPPLKRFRYKMYKIITLKYYEAVIFVWNCLSLVPFVYEWYYIETDEKTLKLDILLSVIYVIFFFIFLSDFLIKLYGMGWTQYFKFWWKRMEFGLLLFSTLGFGLDVYNLITFYFQRPYILNEVNYWLKISRAVYLLKIIQLIQLNIPRILMLVDDRILEDRLSGYNIAQCVIKTQEEIVKYAQYMSEDEGPSFEIVQRESSYRFEVQKDLVLIPKSYNLIGVTVKTKHASKVILNDMKLHVEGLKEKGIIDDMESKLFKEIFNDKYNELNKKVLIPSPLPSSAITGIPWIADDKVVCDYLTECAELLWYQTGEEILSVNNHSKGLYVILYGQATSSFVYSKRANYNQKLYGMLPNCDFFLHLNFDDSQKHDDVLYPGTVLGEIGVLTDRPYNYSVFCTSSVMVSFFSKINIQKAFNLYTNLELEMWKTVAIKVASLKSYLPFKKLHVDTLKYKLQNGYMFILHNCVSLEVNKFSGYIFLLEGTMEDKTNNTKYIAPTYFAEISQNLSFFDNSVNKDLKDLSKDFDKQKVDVKILVVGKYDRNIKVISDGPGKYILIEDQMSSLCERHKNDPSTELEGFSQASFTLDDSNEDVRSIQSKAISKLLKPFRTLNKRTNTSNEDI